ALAALFQVPGVAAGLLLLLVWAASTRSFGVPYLWPLVPFNAQALLAIILRKPVPVSKSRPSIVKPRDEDRL
ncbi:MAG TPA: spore germination protein, partial [Bacillota bacterium]|nr:spore germination protein [Bacillota bacterium]